MTDADRHNPTVSGLGHIRSRHGESRRTDRPTRASRHLMSLRSRSSSAVGRCAANVRCEPPDPWDDNDESPSEQPWHRTQMDDDDYYDVEGDGNISDYYSSQEDNDDDDAAPIDDAGPPAVTSQSRSRQSASLTGGANTEPEQREASTPDHGDEIHGRPPDPPVEGDHVSRQRESRGIAAPRSHPTLVLDNGWRGGDQYAETSTPRPRSQPEAAQPEAVSFTRPESSMSLRGEIVARQQTDSRIGSQACMEISSKGQGRSLVKNSDSDRPSNFTDIIGLDV